MDIVEVDCCNAYFQFLSGRFRVCEELGHYVSCRDAVLEMIGKAFDVPRVEAKKLIISIGFGGSLSTWASKVMRRIPVVAEGGLVAKAVSWLHRLEDGISKTLRECEAVLSPEARQWHKDRQVFLRLPGRGEGSARPHAGGRWSETGVLGARRCGRLR
ncbi:unnamed protein product [Effrenium voratum]|nr:unnamed protein product [Effrenium voratum]